MRATIRHRRCPHLLDAPRARRACSRPKGDDSLFRRALRTVRPAEDPGDGRPQAHSGLSGDRRRRNSSRRASICGSARRPIACARASCPGRGRSVREQSEEPRRRADLADRRRARCSRRGIVYVAPLIERLALRPSLSGAANPKSSTGRLDIFTRLIVDGSEAFDDVPLGYRGELWLEISPRSFSVRVREGSRLNQIRFRSRNSQHKDVHDFTLDRRRHSRPPRRLSAGRRRADLARRADRAASRSAARRAKSSAIARSRTAT